MMATYTGAEQAMVDAWIEARFNDPAIVALLDAIDPALSNRIFPDFAPVGTEYPFIVYQCQDPPRAVRGVGTSVVMVDTLYVVKAVAQVDSYAPLVPVARVIDSAMTSSIGSAVEDGFVLTSVRDRGFALVEHDQGTQFRHFGGEYSIQAQGEQ
jgi:hypothetical protein